MSKIKKILAVVLTVIMVMPIAMFSASAATPAAPEFTLSLVSETTSTVVVRFSLAKGTFSALVDSITLPKPLLLNKAEQTTTPATWESEEALPF